MENLIPERLVWRLYGEYRERNFLWRFYGKIRLELFEAVVYSHMDFNNLITVGKICRNILSKIIIE